MGGRAEGQGRAGESRAPHTREGQQGLHPLLASPQGTGLWSGSQPRADLLPWGHLGTQALSTLLLTLGLKGPRSSLRLLVYS